jgi:hypothetical protein
MNGIPEHLVKEIIAAAQKSPLRVLCEIPFKDKTIARLNVNKKKLGCEGALVLATYLHNNEVLSHLDISQSQLIRGAPKPFSCRDNQDISGTHTR